MEPSSPLSATDGKAAKPFRWLVPSRFLPLLASFAQTGKASTALNMAFKDKLGAQPPLGFFDPLGLVADGDQEKFDRLCYV
jgi:hypothetical protein